MTDKLFRFQEFEIWKKAISIGGKLLDIAGDEEAWSGEQGARSKMAGKLFRFQDLEIWKKAIEIGNKLLDIADDLEKRRLYRFAEQTRGASLSISNNIAEGSGSSSNKEFANFLNMAKRSAFENANMVIVFEKRGLITSKAKDELLKDLEEECKMISGFIRSLKK